MDVIEEDLLEDFYNKYFCYPSFDKLTIEQKQHIKEMSDFHFYKLNILERIAKTEFRNSYEFHLFVLGKRWNEFIEAIKIQFCMFKKAIREN